MWTVLAKTLSEEIYDRNRIVWVAKTVVEGKVSATPKTMSLHICICNSNKATWRVFATS